MRKLEYPSIGETLYRDTLPNGLRLSVAVKPGYTRSYAFFATEYGGADRRFRLDGRFIDTPMGVAHYLEHKMFDMPEGDNAMSLLAANGAQPNAYTASAVTAYHFESTENFDENLRMLLRFVSTPYFTEESVSKERGIIAQEILMGEDDPDHVVYDELMRCLYAAHPIRDKIIGTVESIGEITPEILYDCHRIFYNPGNMALAVVGDVDPEAVYAAASELLDAERGPAPERDYGPPETLLPASTRFSRRMEVSAPQFMLGAKLPGEGRGEALLRRKIVSDVAVTCLYGASSPFFNRLYAEGLVNTDFFADLDYAAGTMTLLAGGESRNPEAVLTAFTAEAEAAAEKGIDPAYFSRVMRSGYGSRLRALSSFGGLAASLADADFGGYNCLDAFAVLETVTEEEVRAFIREYLAEDRFALSVIDVPEEGKGGASDA
ncbi:MAG: insulinase family protein [Oscillospiraceae bacterium]|nr:insulinase family protein [Oscillospiraceae bacterium]